MVGENSGYIAGGFLLFAFGFLAMPHHDISIKKAKDTVARKTPKKAGSRKITGKQTK